jgi:hypothetical protein
MSRHGGFGLVLLVLGLVIAGVGLVWIPAPSIPWLAHLPGDDRPEPLVLVEFDLCISARPGAPNDEVFEGHPLNGRGLEA